MEEDSMPRKLPAPERNSRLDELKLQLNPGVQIQGPLEPSHLLIDKFTAMVETGELRWLPWAELTSREAEFRGSKTEDVLTPEADGVIRVVTKHIEAPAQLNNDLKVQNALRRRGAAMQVARLMSYVAHDEIAAWYFTELQQPPLPGFQRISM